MSAFNLALAATAEMLAKLTHLERMPGGSGALDGLRIEIDGTDEALSITWAKPDVARKAAAYGAELREALRARPRNMPVKEAAEAADDNSSPPAAAPPPCDVPDESAPPPLSHRAAAGDALPSAGEPAPESSGADLSRVPPEAPAAQSVEPPADSNRGRVLTAWRNGGRDVARIASETGLSSQQVIMALKGLRALGLIPKAAEIRAVDRPGCTMLAGETQITAAMRLRAEGYGWGAIAIACGYKSADVASVMVSRHKAAEKSAAAPAPDLRTAAVNTVLDRIGIGDASSAPIDAETTAPADGSGEPDVAIVEQDDEEGQCSAALAPAVPAVSPPPSPDSAAPLHHLPEGQFLVIVKHGGRPWAVGPIAPPLKLTQEEASALHRLQGGQGFALDLLRRAMGLGNLDIARDILNSLRPKLLAIGVVLTGTPVAWVARRA